MTWFRKFALELAVDVLAMLAAILIGVLVMLVALLLGVVSDAVTGFGLVVMVEVAYLLGRYAGRRIG